MELTKRSNFKIDVTNIATTPVVIKTGLKAIDFIGVICTAEDDNVGKSFGIVTGATDGLEGAVFFKVNSVDYIYDPSTGQITTPPGGST